MLGRWMHFNHSFFPCIVALVLKKLRLRDGLKITFQNHFQALEKWHPEYVLGFDTTAPSFQRSRSSAVEDLRAASSFNGIRQKIARISTKEIMRFFLYRKLPFSSATYQPGEFKFQHTEFKATMMIDQFLDAKWPPLSSLFSTREKSKNPLRLTYCLLGLLIYQDTLLILFQAPINTFDHYKDSFQVKFFKKHEEKKSDNCHRHYENDLEEQQCCNFDVTPTFPEDDAQIYACRQ